MHKQRLFKRIALVCLLACLAAGFWIWQTRSATAQSQVRDAWQNVQRSDRYAFTADVEIETIPLPTVGNIGRFSKKDGLYLEGTNDRRNNTLQLALWGGAVSVADPAAAYHVKVQDGRIQTRAGDEAWQNSPSADIAFAPDGDFMAFLDFAKEVTYLGDAREGDQIVAKYGFTVDGPAYARHMRDVTQQRLVAAGSLPPGAAMQTPRHLAEMVGRGELWVDGRGLPLRQSVRLEMPAAEGADYRTDADLTVYFSGYDGVGFALNWWQPFRMALFTLSRISWPAADQVASTGAMLSVAALAAVGLTQMRTRKRRVLVVVNALLLAVIVFTLPAQVGVAHAAAAQMARYYAENDITPPNPLAAPQLPEPNIDQLFAPRQPLVPLSSVNLQSGTLDTDGDGLTDELERQIGTSIYRQDTDGDGVGDYDEVVGFLVGTTRWYGNPLAPDTNKDGIPDGAEWNVDTDGDGTPDLHDWDDDNDGVPDSVDLSRLVGSTDNAGNNVIFNKDNPLRFALNGVRPGSFAYTTLQIRPSNPNRLWYAFNVLNWPKDEKGNAQDWDNMSLFDYCVATGGSDCKMTPDANGDLKFVPMLEIAVANLASLPRLPNGRPDEALLTNYGMSFQPAGDGSFYIYAPLSLVVEQSTGNRVAFEAQLLYQAGTAFAEQQMRLVWAVQFLAEHYADPDQYKAAKNAGQLVQNHKLTVLHAYSDEFRLTGLNVREDRGAQMAIVYEDPALDTNVNYNSALVHLTLGLRNSYLTNRDCDFLDNSGKCVGDGLRDITIPTIKRRWDVDSNTNITESQRWGIEDRLRVETHVFRHEDEAAVIAGSQHAPRILNTRFQNSGAALPTLLFVRENVFRSLNNDGRSAGGPIRWQGNAISFDIAQEFLLVSASFNTAVYKFDTAANGWKPASAKEIVADIEARYPIGPTNLRNSSLTEITDVDQFSTVMVTMVNTQGESAVVGVQKDDPSSTSTLLGGSRLSPLFVTPDLTDPKLLQLYRQSLSATTNQLILSVRMLMSNEAVGLEDLKAVWNKGRGTVQIDGLNKFRYYQGASTVSTPSLQVETPPRSNPNFNGTNFDEPLPDFSKSETNVRSRMSRMIDMIALGTAAAGVLFFTLTFVKGARTAGEIGLAAVNAVSAVVSAVATFRDVALTLKNAFDTAKVAFSTVNVLRVSYSINSSAGKAGVVGAIIGGVITWSLFFAAWGKSGLSPDSIEFNTLLAGAIAATLMLVVTFVLSLTVVGAIALAITAIFDLFALIVCKAGVKKACEVGIMQNITKSLTDWLYTGAVMIETQDPNFPIVSVEQLGLQLTNPLQGLVVGNSVRFNGVVRSRVRHNVPTPSTVYHFPKFYTQEDLASTTVFYTLTKAPNNLKPDTGQSHWPVVRNYGSVTSPAPVPILGWLGAATATKYLFEGFKTDSFSSPVYQFTEARINTTLPLYFNTHMALPRYDCWFGFCAHKSVRTASSENLGEKFILDVLPNTLDGFYWWNQLGGQVDRDGDGLPVQLDPNDSNFDTDGDGLNDAKERELGSDPTKADTDGDGLTDLEEARLGTSPTSADGDGDGISDGAERRLNLLNPTAYPFHPAALNPSPAGLYVDSDDFDNVVAVGQTLVVTTTVRNNTRLQDNLLAQGSFGAQMPTNLGGASNSRNYALLPGTFVEFGLTGAAISGQRFVTVTTQAEANLIPYNTLLRAPTADIEIENPLRLKIDYDNPNDPTLVVGQFVQPGRTAIIGGNASDPTSYVQLVEVSVNGGAYITATGTAIWAFPLEVPNISSGNVPINVRATDAVGNQTTKAFSLTIDGVSPVSTVDLASGESRRVRRNAGNAWTLPLSGNAVDASAGVKQITLQIGEGSNVIVPATAVAANGNWEFAYPFDDIGFNANPAPTGVYTLTVTTIDNALPDGNPAVLEIPFVIDMTPPTVELLSHRDEDLLLTGAVITGTVADVHSAVTSVEYAFVAADTAFATESTLLHLPFNDLPETVVFANLSNEKTRIFCLDATCPTSGVPGSDGTAAQFDGNDVLRNFEELSFPAADVSVAFWFKTTCANCGMLSLLEGAFPDQTRHDWDFFLSAGSVCARVTPTVGSPDLRCTPANTYADGQWHHVVHTLGANGHNLYLDGKLAVSSPATAGLGTLNAVAVGYSVLAGAPYFTGTLDDLVIYDSDLSPAAAVALYRPWRAATLNADNTWSFSLPEALEGVYQIDMRAADSAGNRIESRGDWPQYRGPVDSALPTFDVSVTYSGSGSAAQTRYAAVVRDRNLTAENYSFVCPLVADNLRYATDPAFLAFAGNEAWQTLAAVESACLRAGFQSSLVSAYACDAYGHCGAAQPPQTIAFVGTTLNRLNPFGSLPNAIERVNLSDPANRVRLIERPGRTIYDIEVDAERGKLYWSEGTPGAGQPFAGEIWRANLDGSSPQRLAHGLAANMPEQLQIAIDPAGNKLYWTAGYRLFWANLDGTQSGPVYSIPDDPRVVGGFQFYHNVGDVVVDTLNRKLYISERRNRLRASTAISPHSLIVEMGLTGANPAFVAGVADGCTYANWNSNLGMGVGAGQQPSTCLDLTGGMDIESLTIADGVLYWSAYAGVNSLLQLTDNGMTPLSGPQDPAVWGKRPSQAPFRVAGLPGLSQNNLGLNIGPTPHLYVNPVSEAVFAQYDTQIVRAETGGEFTVFTNFLDETPPPVGATTRRSSTLTALAVIELAATVETQVDLRVDLKSRDLVLIDGESGSLDVTLRNTSGLPAPDATLALTLPADVAFESATRACSTAGDVVTCDFATLAPFDVQTAVITFTVNTTTVRPLTFDAAVSSAAPEANPADNSVSFANITAAPTFSAVPGLPYLYYMQNTTQMVRVPLFGDHQPQPMRFEGQINTVFVGVSLAMASAADGQTLYFFDAGPKLRAVDAQGGNGRVLANAYPTNTVGDGLGRNLGVAVDPTTGQLYYTEQVSMVWSRILRSNADGSNPQTINGRVLMARSLVVDPLLRRLYWIGSDDAMARDLIYRSNLDGSAIEVVYTSPVGRPIRDLALDPYAQMLYWLDPLFEGGAVLRSDADGRRISIISTYNGSGVRGLVVLPASDAVYYVADWQGTLYRNTLDGGNEEVVAYLDQTGVSAVNNLNPAELYQASIGLPASNLVFGIGTPFPPAACDTADTHEPNDTAAAATVLGVGSTNGALCRNALGRPTDIDHYQISVPADQRLTVTLDNLPADYHLEIRQGDAVVASSTQPGTDAETASVDNYVTARTYTVIVYSWTTINNPQPYTLTLALSAAPPRTSYTNAECFAVDVHEATPATGNGSQGSATPITVGAVITGALCFQFDTDFYSFNGVSGQTIAAQLLSYPSSSDYSVHYYRPNGSFFNAFSAANSATQVRLDATGTWAVAVWQHPDRPTLTPYTLQVRDATCGINDAWEPNDLPGLAADVAAARRVNATLCNPSDVDYYALTAAAGQQLTIDFPNRAGGLLQVETAEGAVVGSVTAGARGVFALPAAGNYRLKVANSALTNNDAPYSFVWQLGAPTPAETPFVYYWDGSNVVRVALNAANNAEVLAVGSGMLHNAVAVAPQAGKLYFNGVDTLISVNLDGTDRTSVLNLNPNGASGASYPDFVAVDEPAGHIFYMTRFGGVNPATYQLRRAALDGSGSTVIATFIQEPRGLTVDPLSGLVYWADRDGIYRSRPDGSNPVTLRAGLTVRDLQIEPYTQQLYWVDTALGALVRWAPGSADAPTVVIDNGDGDIARGVALRALHNELYFTRGNTLLRAALNGQNRATAATLERWWSGQDNQMPGQSTTRYLGGPRSNLVIAGGALLADPCAAADGNEPNNSSGLATPTTVVTTTVIDAALCYSLPGWTTADADYYAVEVAPGKVLSATLSNLPADYKLVIIHPDNYAAAFSDNPGLADEFGSVHNATAAPQTYHVYVGTSFLTMSNRQYRLTLELGDPPPPPPALPPDDQACALVDPFDAPAPGGNGTQATATPLTFNTAVLAALCYVDDVDFYSFVGLAWQTVTIDLPTRPADYTLTLRDPSGAAFAVFGAATTPTYGDSLTLPFGGLWTVEVSQTGLTPTTDQYALLVTDENCAATDAQEPNNTPATATPLSADGRARATLCGGSDVDLYTFTATAGQEWTLNYPANATGAALRVYPAGGGADLVSATAGGQTVFTTPDAGAYLVAVANSSLTARDVRYLFQLLDGPPAPTPSGSPYLYSGNPGYLTRAGVSSGSAEPILLDNGGWGGHVIAADTQRNVLYVRTYDEQIARVDPDGRNYAIVIADADPINRMRLPSTLAVDEHSGRIYWSEPTGGVLSRILRADADGSNVMEIIPQVTGEEALAVDPVGGHLYWSEVRFWEGQIRNLIGRSNLNGSDAQIIYAAPAGREIHDLAVDPFGRKLYWIDPTQQSLFWADADGGEPELLRALEAPGRGLVVRPLQNTLYFSSDDRLLRADRDGGNAQEFARQHGNYTGISNLDPGAFFPITLGAPRTNLALAFGEPFAAPCAAVDDYEPNDTRETAAPIAPGVITAALCTSDLNNVDQFDFYMVTVADGKQISVTLSNLPQDYALLLSTADGVSEWSYNPDLADEFVTHINRSGAARHYVILVSRFVGMDSRLPYTLTVELADAPPPPPPPPPPADVCQTVDPYDAPGFDGNWNRDNATPITYNTPITAALCYAADKDFYSWDGQLGQNVTISLDPRPFDYYISIYGPNGQYVTGIFPGSFLQYGGTFVLNATGRWTLAVWYPGFPGTPDQYTLELSFNSDCFGNDPYEPNDEPFGGATLITPTMTLRGVLCQAGTLYGTDQDWFSIPVTRGNRVRITPRALGTGVTLSASVPGGYGFFEADGPIDQVINTDGDLILGFYVSGGQVVDNLPYVVDIQVDPPPVPYRPNNWTCTTYNSGVLDVFIDDLTTLSSPPLSVPITGTLTYVALTDLLWAHGYPEDLTFGIQGPDDTATPLFNLGDYGSFYWCGADTCQLSLADDAQEGLRPPFPVTGGPYRPTRGSFSVFNGLSPQGDWKLLMADEGPSGWNGEWDVDSTGTLLGWELEVCIDNGLPPEPPPDNSPPPGDPTPVNGNPPGATGPGDAPSDAPTSCVAPAADAYEPNNTPATAVRPQELISADHTLHLRGDIDWFAFDVAAGRTYTFTVLNVGGGMDAGLALYEADGSTLIEMTRDSLITLTADETATRYLRISWAGGLRTLCGAAYHLSIEVFDPTVPPPPAVPDGPPAPPAHTLPTVSAGVLLPEDQSVLTDLNPIAAQVGLAADEAIAGASLWANGALVDVYTPARRATQDDYDVYWDTVWTPGAAGLYTLTAVITDTLGGVATSPAATAYVDLAGPTVTLVEETVTQALLQDGGFYLIHGVATDDALVRQVEVRIAGGDWQPAELVGAQWQIAWPPMAAADPDGGSVTVEVRAVDVAGNVAATSGSLTVDVVGPDPFALTVSLTDGRPISPTVATGGLSARITWPSLADAVALHVGWSNAAAATPAQLTAADPAGGNRDQTHGEGSILYAHAIALDALGNQTAVTQGPFYFDSPATPDLIGDLAFVDWPLSGGKQVGRQPGAPAGDQALFAGWNAFSLRLRWSGFDVDGGGDVAFYLGAGGSGGATELLAPQPGAVLPFAADYAVLVSSSLTATLYSATGGAWTAVGPVALASAGGVHDVLIPWSALGVATPASTALHLLAVATEQDGGPVWATIPDKNLGQAVWNQFLYWPSVGAGVIPAAGVWADAQIETVLTAEPDPALPVAPGALITLTVVISNSGSALLPSLTLDGSTTGGLTLSNAPQSTADIAAGAGVTLTLTGSATLTGTVSLTLADSFHRPYDLVALAYTIDDTPPVSITIDLAYVGPFTNTIVVSAQDRSALAAVEVEVNGPNNRAPQQTVACEPSLVVGSFLCLWNPGNIVDGETYQLRGRATDVHGNVSEWGSAVEAPADATPPTLTLSAETLTFLADDKLGNAELGLRGTLSDLAGAQPGKPEGVEACADDGAVLLCAKTPAEEDGTWALTAPTVAGEYTATLSFIGQDAAGNRSAPITRTVWIDREAPRLRDVVVTPTVADLLQPVTFATGIVEDGDAVAALRALIVGPDLSVTQVNAVMGGRGTAVATATNAAWSIAHQFSMPGQYQVLFTATDAAGNTSALPGGVVTAGQPNAILLGSFSAAPQPDGSVLVTWTTEAEWQHAGFLVYRSATAANWGALLTPQLIPSQGLQGQGASYSFRDTTVTQGIWFYTLVDVDIYGRQTPHGPAPAAVGVPTGVGLSSTTVGGGVAAPIAILAGLLLASLIAVRRARRRG